MFAHRGLQLKNAVSRVHFGVSRSMAMVANQQSSNNDFSKNWVMGGGAAALGLGAGFAASHTLFSDNQTVALQVPVIHAETAPKPEEPKAPRNSSKRVPMPKMFRPGSSFDDKQGLAGMRVFSGRSNPQLAQEITELLGVPLGKINIKAYADGEIGIQVLDNVRGTDVYLIQPTCPPGVNDSLMELLLMVSTMRRASARKITAIIPYYGYARQDRKMASRVPISAADVANLLQAMGVDRVVAVDLHCGQIQGFFGPRTPCDNLEGHITGIQYFLGQDLSADKLKIVSPDAGGIYRAKRFRDGMKEEGVEAGLAMIVKQRLKAGEVAQMDLVGSVDGCDVIIVDDMIDTAGTLTKAAQQLKDRGARRVYAFATHGLFNGPALDRIEKSCLEKVVVCNTIPLPANRDIPANIVSLSVAPLLAEAIVRIQLRKSVSQLFETAPPPSAQKA